MKEHYKSVYVEMKACKMDIVIGGQLVTIPELMHPIHHNTPLSDITLVYGAIEILIEKIKTKHC